VGDLTTLANVKEYLGLPAAAGPQDALLGKLVTRISSMIEQHSDRVLSQAAVVQYMDGSGTPTLSLREYPVSAVASVYYSENNDFTAPNLVASSEYFLDPDRGLLIRKGFMPWMRGAPRNHKVSYTAGYAIGSMHPAIEHVAILMVARAWGTKENPFVTSQSLRDGSITVKAAAVDFSDLLKQLSAFRARRV
jgi:hypothetical protein